MATIGAKKLVERRECPVCMIPLSPPVFQCHNGHLICEPCLSQMTHCPICREEYSERKIRARGFEELMSELFVDCRHKRFGCESAFGPEELGAHELICEYRGVQCPGLDEPCSEMVLDSLLTSHLENAHQVTGTRISELGQPIEITQDCSIDEIRRRSVQILSKFIIFEDKRFYVRTHISPDCKFIGWTVTSEDPCEFNSVIKLVSTMPSTKSALHCQWSGQILTNKEMVFRVEEKNFLIVPISLLELYGDQVFPGHYAFTIRVKFLREDIHIDEKGCKKLQGVTRVGSEDPIQNKYTQDQGYSFSWQQPLGPQTIDKKFEKMRLRHGTGKRVSGRKMVGVTSSTSFHGPRNPLHPANDAWDEWVHSVHGPDEDISQIHSLVVWPRNQHTDVWFSRLPISLNQKVIFMCSSYTSEFTVGFTNKDPESPSPAGCTVPAQQSLFNASTFGLLHILKSTRPFEQLTFSITSMDKMNVKMVVPFDRFKNFVSNVKVSEPMWAFVISSIS